MDTFVIAADWLPLLALVGSGLAALGIGRARVSSLLAQALLVVGCALVMAYVAGRLHGSPTVVDTGGRVAVNADADGRFPSEQTTFPAALALLTTTVRRRVGLGLLVVAGCGGLARIVVNVDHVPDVAGGLVVAGLSVLVGTAVWRRLPQRVVEAVRGAP